MDNIILSWQFWLGLIMFLFFVSSILDLGKYKWHDSLKKWVSWLFGKIVYIIGLIILFFILSAILTPMAAAVGEGTFIIIVLLFMILHNQEKLLDK